MTRTVNAAHRPWEISSTLAGYLWKERLYIHFNGVRIDDKLIRRHKERLAFLKDAIYFAKVPATVKINWVHHWLWQQGIERPWEHRLQVKQAGENETISSIYGFLPGQDALAVHFKLRWS